MAVLPDGQGRMGARRGAGTITRVLLANPKEGVSREQLEAAASRGREVIEAIPGVMSFSFGIAAQPGASYYCSVLITFRDAGAFEVYLTHPGHLAFGEKYWLPIIADQIVVDCTMSF